MSGQVQISGQLTSVPIGQVNVGPFTIVANSFNNYAETSITFASGATTITVPTWAVGAIIVPNTANAVGWTLKGVTGDTGIAQSLTAPTLLNFAASPPASFVITAAGAFSTITSIIFF